jgi:hypothetical protein
MSKEVSHSNQFISTEIVKDAIKRKVEVPIGSPKLLGVSVARFKDDQTVIAGRHGSKVEILVKLRGLDTMQVAAKVAEIISAGSPDAIFVDGVGAGAGVVDRLNQLGFKVFDVLSDKSPDPENRDTYGNKRTEMWGRMREWLEGADIPDDTDLVNDLIGPEYGHDNNRIQLEEKEGMKERGLSSPEAGDALALTFAYPTPPVAAHNPQDLIPEHLGHGY